MRERDRTAFAAIESLIGASLTVGGFLAVGLGGPMVIVGAVLALLGAGALAQAVAVGLGFITPPAHDERDRSRRR
jgi:hypothetical protein